jgi:hypothetical protein
MMACWGSPQVRGENGRIDYEGLRPVDAEVCPDHTPPVARSSGGPGVWVRANE